MSIYFDTSVIVGLIAKEALSDDIVAFIERNSGTPLFLSDWNVTEFAAALSFKLNLGTILLSEQSAIENDFKDASISLFNLIEVMSSDFHLAAKFAAQQNLRLRSGDALHLAIAANRNLKVLTLDKRMAAAGMQLGIQMLELEL